MTREELDQALLIAHTTNDTAQLVVLYQKAFELERNHDPDAGYYYLTQAYVYALDIDHSDASNIEPLLKKSGRL